MEGPEITATEAVLDNGRFGTRTVRFETGRLAQQAQGAVAAYLDEETMLLSATSAGKHPREGFDFFPLTVDVEERSYAAGKIPGSFFRREGRPGEQAILTCRLTDRPLRPSFPSDFRNEVQVIATILGVDLVNPHDVVSINGASAALTVSGIPFNGPIGAVAPECTRSMVCSVASASTIMIATSPSGRRRPATTMSKTADSSCEWLGKATHWPSMSATRTPPTGPENGRTESWVDSDAALIASTS